MISNLRIYEHQYNSHVSNNSTNDYMNMHNGIANIEIIKFESLGNNYMQLPALYPWPSWMSSQFQN